MFKLIIKNLWSRRRRNAALLVELVIITLVAWISLDTVIVNTYVRNMPLGYDMERIVKIEFGHEGVNPEDENDDARDRALRRFASNLESRRPSVSPPTCLRAPAIQSILFRPIRLTITVFSPTPLIAGGTCLPRSE